jgi:hypothetical protein
MMIEARPSRSFSPREDGRGNAGEGGSPFEPGRVGLPAWHVLRRIAVRGSAAVIARRLGTGLLAVSGGPVYWSR